MHVGHVLEIHHIHNIFKLQSYDHLVQEANGQKL